MREIVRSNMWQFTDRFEGWLPYMYLDVKGLVTIGRGDLIDPIDCALSLPFVRKADGHPVSRGNITDEWNTVKSLKSLAPRGGRAFASVTQLQLTREAVDDLSGKRLGEIEAYLRRRFSQFELWPAAAQLGTLSMSWAMGPGFVFPHFAAAALRQDWATCATECYMQDADNPGLRPRNAANRALFTFAAQGGDPDSLPEVK